MRWCVMIEQLFDTSNVSLSYEVPQQTERRGDERELTILRIAKLVTERGEELCRIRNISAGGIRAETTHSHAVGEHVVIELRADQRLAGSIAWSHGTSVGVLFDESIDIAQVLSKAANDDRHHARQPRIEAPCVARLLIGTESYFVPVTDISQGGIKVASREIGCVGALTVVTVDGLPSVEGSIRWLRDGHAGIAFNVPFPFDELTRWLGMRLAGHREPPIRPTTVIRPLGEAIGEITGEVVASPGQDRPYTAVITMAGKIIAQIDVPSVIAGEAMIKSVVESMEQLR
jgi:hypothetical protein